MSLRTETCFELANKGYSLIVLSVYLHVHDITCIMMVKFEGELGENGGMIPFHSLTIG